LRNAAVRVELPALERILHATPISADNCVIKATLARRGCDNHRLRHDYGGSGGRGCCSRPQRDAIPVPFTSQSRSKRNHRANFIPFSLAISGSDDKASAGPSREATKKNRKPAMFGLTFASGIYGRGRIVAAAPLLSASAKYLYSQPAAATRTGGGKESFFLLRKRTLNATVKQRNNPPIARRVVLFPTFPLPVAGSSYRERGTSDYRRT